MKLKPTPITDSWVVEPERLGDERGWFARTFDAEHFAEHGLSPVVAQTNASFNARRGTLRGMHFQAPPHAEPKLVRCVRGAIYDVALDLRPDSSTYCQWHAVELSGENGLALYLPPGLAHGFQTLVDDCEVHYQMGYRFVPDAARGVRWDDPAFGIRWPEIDVQRTISAKDRSYENFVP